MTVYEMFTNPPSKCNVCNEETKQKMVINDVNKTIKVYHICDKCKKCACDTLKLKTNTKEKYTGE
jgi:hypothetical protein